MTADARDDHILLKSRDGIARVVFNRPAVRNALSVRMCETLVGFLNRLLDDPELRVLVITGAGEDFTSGADVREMADLATLSAEQRSREVGRQVAEISQPIFGALHRIKVPVVASVRGYAIGAGMQFALGADLVIASETAKFSTPVVRLGHTPDHGESYSLVRKVGLAHAAQILMLSEFVDAAEAGRLGIANWVISDSELESRTEAIVKQLLGMPPVALAGVKSLLCDAGNHNFDQQLAAELDAVKRCAASEDFAEALTALREKRPARFLGR